jgi:hypothetical protein
MSRRSILRFLRSRLLPVLAAGLAAVAAPLSRADDGASRTITASAGQVARGVKGYEVGVAASDPASVWVCQVVGDPNAAGAIRLTSAVDGVRLDASHVASGDTVTLFLAADGGLFVVHQGVQVATHIPAPAVGLPGTTVGEDVLPQLPAWRVLSGAFADAGLQSALASVSSGSVSCKAACDASVAVPPQCVDQPSGEYCCLKRADLGRCHAYCDCDSSPATSVACKLSADAAWAWQVLLCTLFAEPLEP